MVVLRPNTTPQNKTLSKKFNKEKQACYFNPGVLVVNAPGWRKMGATKAWKRATCLEFAYCRWSDRAVSTREMLS